MAREEVELAILGAGIAGCALAYHLALLGNGPTVVIDPRTPAAGASGRAAGVVTEQLWNPWDVEVVRESHREYATLCGQWEPNAYRRNGFVRWSHRAEAVGPLTEAVERLRGWGVTVELLDGSKLERRMPEAAFGAEAVGLDSPHDGCVDPTALTGIYAEAARSRGVRFELGTGPPRIQREDGRWLVHVPTVEVRARRLVLAAGAWTKAIAGQLGQTVPLTPYRTQLTLLRPSAPARPELPTGHDIDEDVYVRPEANGRILAGNGTESVEADPERFATGGDDRFLDHIATSLSTRWPRWGDSEVVAAWAGVCCSTPDRRPLIGAVPGASDLFVIAGFNGFGVMRGGGAARRLALLLSEAEGASAGREQLAPVDPGRFPPGTLGRPPRPGFTLEGGSDPRF
jgi:sarcosine oxidase, subunit beta